MSEQPNESQTTQEPAVDKVEQTAIPESTSETKPKAETIVSFNTFILGILLAVLLSSLVSVMTVRLLAKNGYISSAEANIVTLDTNKLLAEHAKVMSTQANNPEEVQALNQRFLVGFQQNIDAYKKQNVLIIQQDATVTSPFDVTDAFVRALIPAAPAVTVPVPAAPPATAAVQTPPADAPTAPAASPSVPATPVAPNAAVTR